MVVRVSQFCKKERRITKTENLSMERCGKKEGTHVLKEIKYA